MKAKSITTIREMLQLKVDNASYHYKVTKATLEEKYETEWLDNKVTEEEKSIWHDYKKVLREAEELLEDFENHQW